MISKLYQKLISFDREEKKLLSYLTQYAGAGRVLDVGCGYGRVLKYLQAHGIEAWGVDINPELVDACRKEGLNSVTVAEFSRDAHHQQKWDAIVMFHVIEHMGPERCVEFIDNYLDLLNPGGVLIIATPILTSYFYEDFDHVKPYLPRGIQMVFGVGEAQVQFRSRNKLELLELWYKRYFLRPTNQRMVYLQCFKIMLLVTGLSALAFKFSLGLIGKKDGWVGVFRKVA